MNLHERMIDIIGGKRLADERRANTEALDRVLRAGRMHTPPGVLIEQLSEYVGASGVAQLIRNLQQQGSGYSYLSSNDDMRVWQLNESRYQWLTSPLAQWSVLVWTSSGLGDKVTVTLNDKDGQELWNEVWNNSSIFDDDQIHGLSNWTLVDGEIYLAAFCSIADGKVSSFELMDTDEIKEIITNPDNKNQTLYYKREYIDTSMKTITVYYPDYHAYFYNDGKDLEAYKLPADAKVSTSDSMGVNKGTCVLILHIPHNRKDPNSPHGWPLLGIAASSLNAHKEFIQDRLTIVKNKAMYVRDYEVTGGSRGVAAVKNKLGTGYSSSTLSSTGYTDPNPPPVAGSSGIHNDMIKMTDLPMTTGAGDADADNKVISWFALIGTGLFPTTAGLDTSRWATAVAMDKTQAAQWAQYQTFWACQFKKMVEIVLLAAEKWGNVTFDDKGCTVSIDTLSLVDFPGVVTPISQLLGNLNTLKSGGILEDQAARQIIKGMFKPVLSALGTDKIDEILSDELLGILDEKQRKELKQEQEEAKKAMAAIQPKPPETEEPKEEPDETAAEYAAHMTEFAMSIYKRRIAEKEKEGNVSQRTD